MTRLQQPPAAVIRQLQDLLQRYRGGFSIIKELVQNADDAHATQVNIVWTLGIPNETHPLLKGPAIVAINNGKFDQRDEEAVRSFGVNYKVGDASAIGKFGLGLKSIFHLCESFFYLGFDPAHVASDVSTGPRGDVLNPWIPALHTDWEGFLPESRSAVQRHLAALIPDARWFCLWAPLRQHKHVEGGYPICGEFFDDKTPAFLAESDIPHRLAQIMPLLGYVRCINGWALQAPGAPPISLFSAQMSEDYARRSTKPLANSSASRIGGAIYVSGHGDEVAACVATGLEFLASDNGFEVLKQRRPGWPHLPSLESPAGTPEQKTPHGAVYFMSLPSAESGTLSMSWASFLPLAEPFSRLKCRDGNTYAVFLHGHFFVDSSRTRLDGLDSGDARNQDTPEEKTRKEWNLLLAQKAVLPLVLPALRDFVTKGGLDNKQILELTRSLSAALGSSPTRSVETPRSLRQGICAAQTWLWRLADDGGEWVLLDNNLPFHEVPPVPDSTAVSAISDIFPGIRDASKSYCITVQKLPRLGIVDPSPWPEPLLVALLTSVPAHIFAVDQSLQYLVAFLKGTSTTASSDNALNSLIAIARRNLATCDLRQLKRHPETVRQFFQLIPSPNRISLDFGAHRLSELALREVCKLDVDSLLLPRDLEPEERGTGILSATSARKILKLLVQIRAPQATSDDALPFRSHLAVQVLKHTRDQSGAVLKDFGGEPLFTGYDCRERTRRPFCYDELKAAYIDGTVFVERGSEDHGIAESLQEALSEAKVIVLSRSIADVLFPDSDVPYCDNIACFRHLLKRPPLATPPARVRLLLSLKTLIGEPASEQRKCLRYLLHGIPAHFDDPDVLITGEVHGANVTPYRRIIDHAFKSQQRQWRLLSNTIAGVLAPEDHRILGVRTVDRDGAEELLHEIGPEQFDGSLFSSTERDRLLLELDVDMLRRMPIHQDCEGNFCAIDAVSYWEGDFPVHVSVRPLIRLLKCSNDVLVRTRQKQIAPTFDATIAIEVVRRDGRPQGHWQAILDAISAVSALGEDQQAFLRAAEWMPTNSGSWARPDDVISIRNLDDDVARIVSRSSTGFCAKTSLHEDVTGHPAFSRVTQWLLPKSADAIGMLGEIMEPDESWSIGIIPLASGGKVSSEWLDHFLEHLQDAPSGVMPCHAILSKLAKTQSQRPLADGLVASLRRPMSTSRLVNVLKYLRSRYSNVTRERRAVVLTLHNTYLSNVAAKPDFLDAFPEIQLMSRLGHWKSPGQLCYLDVDEPDAASGLSSNDIVDASQGELLRDHLLETSSAKTELQPNELNTKQHAPVEGSADVAQRYFAEWDGYLPPEAIGGCLAILGDDPKLKALARGYLRNRNLEITRERLGFRNDAILKTRRVALVVADVSEKAVSVCSLLGTPFFAQLASDSRHLLLLYAPQAFPTRIENGMQITQIRLRRVSPGGMSAGDLSKLLCETTRLVLRSLYRLPDAELGSFWAELEHSEQLDIRIAQKLIRGSVPFYFRQLGVQEQGDIRRYLSRWDEARRGVAEAEADEKKRGWGPASEQFYHVVNVELPSLLERPGVKEQILAAIRDKVSNHYRYTCQSIPLELFQNADDASCELSVLEGQTDQPDASTQFVVRQNGDHVQFIHWGRRINEYARGTVDRRDLGYDRDLEKMLVLSSSDKMVGREVTPVTGKFGLGFKSVFLAADVPRVLSGNLGFAVFGGVYPERLQPDEYVELRGILDHYDSQYAGTIVSLDLTRTSAGELLQDFLSLGHLLLVFSRRIKRLRLERTGSQDHCLCWQEEPVLGISGLSRGNCTATPANRTQLMVCRGVDCAILWAIGLHGVETLRGNVPTIWVTAPTREPLSLGFAINGNFDLDIGRARLAGSTPKNEGLERHLGETIADRLDSLYQASSSNEGWQQLISELELARDCGRYEFWLSFWESAGRRVSPHISATPESGLKLVHTVLWDESHGAFPRFYARCAALPNGVAAEDYRRLTSSGEVRFRAVGILDSKADVFTEVSKWPTFRRRVPPIAIVSDAGIAQVLKRLCPDLLSEALEPVTLARCVEWELADCQFIVDSNTAERLGRLLKESLLRQMENGSGQSQDEARQIRQTLAQTEFFARDGHHRPVRTLLLSVAPTDDRADEVLRAGFAPDSHVLIQDYSPEAIEFFVTCRHQFDAPASLLADWAVAAESIDQRIAVLSYLAKGLLRDRLANELRTRVNGAGWLAPARLESSDAFRRFTPSAQQMVRSIVKFDGPILKTVPEREPEAILCDIYEWWCQSGSAVWIPKFQRQYYPGGKPPRLSRDDDVRGDLVAAKGWVTLFMVGIMHTMGRVRREDNRSFLELCERKQWMDVFADPQASPDRWIAVIDRFFEDQVDENRFLHWMRQYVSIRGLSRSLRDYVDLFLDIDLQGRHFDLGVLTRPRSDPTQQGGGIDAPPIPRVLGIGACFVVRELMRSRVLVQPWGVPHCYVPTLQMRRLMIELQCLDPADLESASPDLSRKIYRRLVQMLGEDRSRFDHGFDLPLLAVAEREELQIQFLGHGLQ